MDRKVEGWAGRLLREVIVMVSVVEVRESRLLACIAASGVGGCGGECVQLMGQIIGTASLPQ